MSDEIQIDGLSYISSKRAGQISGYTQDYIGQLCRAGVVQTQKIGGLWYVTLDSLYQYKKKADSYVPTVPRKEAIQQTDTLMSFDGKEYISAARAAEITGYNKDYIGQLAREGVVLSRRITNRWYVERTGIVSHKKQKDALLGAVQAEAVGISRPSVNETMHSETLESGTYDGAGPYLTYKNEEGDLLPVISDRKGTDDAYFAADSFPTQTQTQDKVHKVPIRVLERELTIPKRYDSRAILGNSGSPTATSNARPKPKKSPLLVVSSAVATIVIVLLIGYVSVMGNALYAQISPSASASALVAQASGAISTTSEILEYWLVPEMVYHRKD